MNIDKSVSLQKEMIKSDNKKKQLVKADQKDADPLSWDRICLHSRKIFGILDRDDQSKSCESMHKHLENCEYCHKQYLKLLKFKEMIVENIPDQRPDKRMQDSFKMEVREVLAKMEVKAKFIKKPEMFLGRLFSFFNI